MLSQFLHNEKILVDRRTILYQKPEPLLIEIDDDSCDEEDDEVTTSPLPFLANDFLRPSQVSDFPRFSPDIFPDQT
ncbi:unnamed protein product [Anisakis simplex]|uniref:Uncharacterized protein n=1 Tax=Anisakis simplex TaxID=6269 RepID=A0A3P6QML9_ANISI|nr:unnamed protein product [Anisakis simplex]